VLILKTTKAARHSLTVGDGSGVSSPNFHSYSIAPGRGHTGPCTQKQKEHSLPLKDKITIFDGIIEFIKPKEGLLVLVEDAISVSSGLQFEAVIIITKESKYSNEMFLVNPKRSVPHRIGQCLDKEPLSFIGAPIVAID